MKAAIEKAEGVGGVKTYPTTAGKSIFWRGIAMREVKLRAWVTTYSGETLWLMCFGSTSANTSF